jgi:hypothetical protein
LSLIIYARKRAPHGQRPGQEEGSQKTQEA